MAARLGWIVGVAAGSALCSTFYIDGDSPEIRIRQTLRRVIAQQVLRPQFPADLLEGFIDALG